MCETELLKKTRIIGAPFAGRLLPETVNYEFAQHLDAGRPDAHGCNQEILASDLNTDPGSNRQPFLKVVRRHWTGGVLSYQRMTWYGGFHSGPRNFTIADTERLRSESCPLAKRGRAVARRVRIGLGASDSRPIPGPALENWVSWLISRSGVVWRRLTIAFATSAGIPMARITAGSTPLAFNWVVEP